jgi:hypothetical protein
MAVRKEFLEIRVRGRHLPEEVAEPISLDALVALRPGQAMARLGGGAFAVPLHTLKPMEEPPAWRGEKVRETSWKTYGVAPIAERTPGSAGAGLRQAPRSGEKFLGNIGIENQPNLV